MREIIELVGQWVAEWFIYTVLDFVYGTQSKKPRFGWVAFLRFLLCVLTIYAAAGLASALYAPALDHLAVLYPNALVVFALMVSFFLPVIVGMGEHRLGKTSLVWLIVAVWGANLALGVFVLLGQSTLGTAPAASILRRL